MRGLTRWAAAGAWAVLGVGSDGPRATRGRRRVARRPRARHRRRTATLVSLPNVAGNDADLRQNADRLVGLFEQRGFTVEQSSGPGSPVVFASLDVPAPRGTIVLYIHYDGQPVDPAEWTRCKPFAPCVYGPSGEVQLQPETRLDPDWRVYGRSASDDKGPIVAVLNAVEALRATNAWPTWTLRVVLDGEEEAGSANFRRFAAARAAALTGDLAMTLDGPRHPSGRPTLYYGVRGGTGVTLTCTAREWTCTPATTATGPPTRRCDWRSSWPA